MPRMQTQKLFFTGNSFVLLSFLLSLWAFLIPLSKISPVHTTHTSTLYMRQRLGDVVCTTVKMLQPSNFK